MEVSLSEKSECPKTLGPHKNQRAKIKSFQKNKGKMIMALKNAKGR